MLFIVKNMIRKKYDFVTNCPIYRRLIRKSLKIYKSTRLIRYEEIHRRLF